MNETKLNLEEAMTQAIGYDKNGRFQDAEKLYREILKANPRHPDANYNLGMLAVSVDKPEAGLVYLKTAVEAAPSNSQHWASFIDTLINAGRYEAASKAIAKVRSLGLSGDHLDKLVRISRTSQMSIFAKMITLREAGEYKNALAWLNEYLGKNSQNAEAHGHHAHILLLLDRVDEAHEAIHRSCALDNNLPVVQRNLSRVLLVRKMPVEALKAAHLAYRAAPQDPENQLVLAVALGAGNDMAQAMCLVESALKEKPNYAEAFAQRANFKLQTGDTKGALADIQNALIIKPHLCRLWSTAAFLYMQMGNLDKAILSLEKAVDLEPENAQFLASLGDFKRQAGDHEKAIFLLEKAVELAPKDVTIWTNYGTALQQARQLRKAQEAYEKALFINPNIAEVANNLGVLLKDTEGWSAALPYFEKAVSLQPERWELYPNLVTGLFEVGRLKESLQVAMDAVNRQLNLPLESLTNSLVRTLNYSTVIEDEASDDFSKAEIELRKINLDSFQNSPIGDESIRFLHEKAQKIVTNHGIEKYHFSPTQIFRGKRFQGLCSQYKVIFDMYRIIPDYCFGCYKIVVEPKNILEHMKVFLAFNYLNFPDDNLRKCITEVRPEIPGHYKSYVYCRNHSEAENLLPLVEQEILNRVNGSVKIYIKRGCSEFAVKYPDYNKFDDNGKSIMHYPEEWGKYEKEFDTNWHKEDSFMESLSSSHSGFTLFDALVMRNWVSYAKNIGDHSLLQIFSST